MIANNTLDPMYSCVVKYYQLKKQIYKELAVPFVLVYTRPDIQSYRDLNYKDRVDIDIETAIKAKYPDASPQTILMDTEERYNFVLNLTQGFHYNAAIQFIDDGINTFDSVKFYRYPARIEQLLSLYCQDEQNAFYLKNELTVFTLPGGGIIDYHIDELKCNCQKLAYHPLFCPALISLGRGNNNLILLFYNLTKKWDQTVILYVEDCGENKNIKALFGDDLEARNIMSRLLVDVTDTTRFYRLGTSGIDMQLYKNTKEMFNQLFANETDNRVKDALTSLDRFEEI